MKRAVLRCEDNCDLGASSLRASARTRRHHPSRSSRRCCYAASITAKDGRLSDALSEIKQQAASVALLERQLKGE